MVISEDAILVEVDINQEGNGQTEETIKATTAIKTGNTTLCRPTGTTTNLNFNTCSINNSLGRWQITTNTHSLSTTMTRPPQSHLQSIVVLATHSATLLGNVIRNYQHNMALNFPINANRTQKTIKPSQLQSSLNCFSTPTSSPLFSVPLSFSSYSIHALVDTGAFSSALTPDHLSKIRLKNPNAISNESKTSIPVKVANGQKLSRLGSVVLTFKLGGQSFSEPFLLLKTMN